MVEPRSDAVKPLARADIEDEGVDVLFLVWMAARSTQDLVDRALAPTALSADDYAVFSMLRATGGMTPTELSRWMATPPTTVSAFVKRCSARGLLLRTPHATDGRSSVVRLTEQGRRTHDAARRRFTSVRQQVDDRLGGGADAVRAALIDVRTAVDGIRSAPPGP